MKYKVDFTVGDSAENRVILALEIIEAFRRNRYPSLEDTLEDIEWALRQNTIEVYLDES